MKKRALALALTLILCLGLLPTAQAAVVTFTDVPRTYWGYADIKAAAEAGLMNGTGNRAFSPEMKVSVAQFLTLVGRSLFPDVEAQGEDWAGPYILSAQGAGLLNGTKVNTNEPQADISRYDIAVILWRSAKLMGADETAAQPDQVGDYTAIPGQYAQAVLAVYGMGLIQGDQQGNFNGERAMTRAEVATVVMRLITLSQDKEKATPTPAPTKPSQAETETASTKPDPEGARKAIIQGLTEMRTKMIDTTPYNIRQDDLATMVDEILNETSDRYFVFTPFWGPLKANNQSTGVGFRYYGTREEYDQYKEEMKGVRAKAEEIVATTVHEGMSDYEIAKALHDYIVLNVEYDHNWLAAVYNPNAKLRPSEHGIYYPLIEHTALCSSYSQAYKYLMNLAGVPCEYISGDSDGTDKIAASIGYAWGVDHAWNIVQIDGEWYHVDTTWDDLGGNRIRYDYFLKSDKAMKGHYDWEAPHSCTSTKYDNMTDTLNEQQQVQQQADQEAAWESKKAILMVDFMERFNTLPYRSEEGLTGTDDLDDDELLSYLEDKVYFPMDQYTYDEMENMYFAAANSPDDQVFKLNEQFFASSYEDDQWYLEVWRWDIWREYERRHESWFGKDS